MIIQRAFLRWDCRVDVVFPRRPHSVQPFNDLNMMPDLIKTRKRMNNSVLTVKMYDELSAGGDEGGHVTRLS